MNFNSKVDFMISIILGSAVFAHHFFIKNPIILGISKTKKCAFVALSNFVLETIIFFLQKIAALFFGWQLKRPAT
jgi:hypothetical protein